MSAPEPIDPIAAIGAALDNPSPAPTMAEPGERVPERDEDAGDAVFPLDCPVKPLGMSSGLDGSQRCYYLNVNGEIVGLEAGNKHGKNNLVALFGHKSKFLESEWPQWSKPIREYNQSTKQWVEISPAKLVGFDQARASRNLIEECSRRGIFDPVGRMRGRGAHPLNGGGLVMHFGDGLATLLPRANGSLRDLQWHDTGLHDGFVYPAGTSMPRPWATSVPPTAALTVAKLLRSWYWKRPDLDPILALGAIGQGYLGGALPWRSNVWITGMRGTGKSSLNGRTGLIPGLFGEGVFRTGNTSAAAIRQMLKNSTRPVMIDEAEPGADNRKITEVVELARIASSGDKLHRGGQDHNAHEFTLQSPFWFSSINIPPMEASDRSRLAILELKPIPAGVPPLDLSKYDFAELGRKLQRRMVDAWPVLAECKHRYHLALAAKGHDSRGCDQFGVLLACAWMALNDELPEADEVHEWISLCAPDRMAEVSEATSDEEACINALLTQQVQPRGRDSREAISTLIGRAVAGAIAPDTLAGGDDVPRRAMEQVGLKLVNLHWTPAAGGRSGRWGAVRGMAGHPMFLAVSARHKALDDVFSGTKWQGGVHKQTLARIDGAIDGVIVKMADAAMRTVMVPLYAVLHESLLPDASKPDAASAWMTAQVPGGEG